MICHLCSYTAYNFQNYQNLSLSNSTKKSSKPLFLLSKSCRKEHSLLLNTVIQAELETCGNEIKNGQYSKHQVLIMMFTVNLTISCYKIFAGFDIDPIFALK